MSRGRRANQPTQFADEISLVGPRERIAERLEAWNASPVTTIIVNGDLDTLRTMAELTFLNAENPPITWRRNRRYAKETVPT
jgi:hypothetical protein